MDAEDPCPSRQRENVRGDGADQHRVVALPRSDPAEKRLARGPDEDREPEGHDFVEAVEQFQVVIHRLAEPDPGVEKDPLACHTGVERHLRAALEKGPHLRDHVAVPGVILHRPRLAAHVHEADVAPGFGDEVRHPGGTERPDVVDERRADRDRRARHGRLHGVHGHAGAGRHQAFDHGHNPPQFLCFGNIRGAGTRGFSADIKDRRPFAQEREAVRDGSVRIKPPPAV